MDKVEDYNDYKTFCIDKLSQLSKEIPNYTFGELIQSVRHHLRKDAGKSFFEAEDAEIYRAISIAAIKEKNN
jgi:hypothetical protein